ncbi:A/G-specific adenine glycosylase [Devosia pacifica]|uniref:Adenine DNA glycosylase n=1 Tax=Devosia pacifica TaxID=1335967 RepID=A0A918VWS3_9HYPH|nr:A/G-specific adenine glycosylase [Devosia pacifica]GHA30460.1 A/G-specific adenine glycosylase [Devosia pacifica]
MMTDASQPPAINSTSVLDWYDRHARTLAWRVSPEARRQGVRPDPYRVWLSEVMLQQTTIGAATRYYLRFLELWPSVEALAAAPREAVLVEWAGLGYYARARNLHACAQVVVDEHQGVFPDNAAALMKLPGIGAYTSAAIAAICHDEPVAVLDGNVERVLARYLALETPVRDAKPLLRRELQRAVPARAGDFAQAMMDLGATICAPRTALCTLCPLQPDCCAAAQSEPTAYPVRPAKAERPVRYGHAYVICDRDGDVYLRTRPDTGLLAAMTEVPTSEWLPEPTGPGYPIEADWHPSGRVVHVFTHFRLELEVWRTVLDDRSQLTDGWWSDPRDARSEALPSLFRKVLAQALD